MNKWDELRNEIQELHDNNQDKPDVVALTQFLLNFMNVLDNKEKGKEEKDETMSVLRRTASS